MTEFFHLARCLQGSPGCNNFIPLLSDSFRCVDMHMLYVLSSTDEYVGHFQFFAIMENAIINICEGRDLGVEWLVLMATLCLTF